MARFLLAWEFGAGLGHAGRLQPLAQALLARGHQLDFMLRDLVQTRTLLQPLGQRCFQAPVWLHQTHGLPQPPATLSEILAAGGYLRPHSLAALMGGWRDVMEQVGADAVVADYAPTAILAARACGIPSASVGLGFFMPPDLAPLPSFRTWETLPAGRAAHHHQAVLDCINAALAEHGAKPLDRVAQALRGDLPLLCTWRELDQYEPGLRQEQDRYMGPSILPAAGMAPHWPEGDGPRALAYLKASHPDHVMALQALLDQGCRVLCYLPEVAHGQPAPLRHPRLHFSPRPVNLAEALADSALLACHAGEGTVAQGLLAGVPLLLLPMQAEQYLMAQRVEASGAGMNVAARPRPAPLASLVKALLGEPRYRDAARRFAAHHADFSHEGQTQALVQAIEGLLPSQ